MSSSAMLLTRAACLLATAVFFACNALALTSGDDQIDVSVSSAPLTGLVIASDFVSFSFEVTHAKDMLSFRAQPRTSLVTLMNVLRSASGGAAAGTRGPNVRVGGNSADESAWIEAPAPLPPHSNITYRITRADVLAYAAALPLFNGTLSPGLNFRFPDSASLAIAHQKGLLDTLSWTDALGGLGILAAIEIGNEPDLYFKNGIRNSTFVFTDYDSQFGVYVDALTPLLPQKRIQGGTFCCFFEADISHYLAEHRHQLATFSQHSYALSNCKKPKRNPNTVDMLLDNAASTGKAQHHAQFVRAANAVGVPYVIGEGNSISCGGQSNVSDTFAAALWAIDTLLEHASVGVERWNFHMGPAGSYSAILYAEPATEDVPVVQPLFYGMWATAFALANQSTLLKASVQSSDDLIKAHAVTDVYGVVRVVLLHKAPNATAPAAACVSLEQDLKTPPVAELYRLLAPSVHANMGVTFANQTFDASPDGSPRGERVFEAVAFDDAQQCYAFALPPGSAAVLVIQ